MRGYGLLLILALALPAGAQPIPVTAQPPLQRASDELARLETAHVKEMLALIERKNDQIRLADLSANEQRFKAQEQAVAFALQAAEKAVTKAELAAEKRFESVNEFRNQLKDQTGTFITRNEMWGWLVALIMMAFSAWNVLRSYIGRPRGDASAGVR